MFCLVLILLGHPYVITKHKKQEFRTRQGKKRVAAYLI